MSGTFSRAGSVDPFTVAWGVFDGTLADYQQVVVVGSQTDLASVGVDGGPLSPLFPSEVTWALDALRAGLTPALDDAKTATALLPGDTQVVFGVLPTAVSRHNSPALPHAVSAVLKSSLASRGSVLVAVFIPSAEYGAAIASAIGSAMPVFSGKSSARSPVSVNVTLFSRDGSAIDYSPLDAIADSVRFAAGLVDMPTSHLHTDEFVAVARDVAAEVGANITVLQRETLPADFGGLWGVGQAAAHPPALVILEYVPKTAPAQTIVMVGKGIVYDTGGLSIKDSLNMPGMKRDMGGAAGILGGFRAIAKSGTCRNRVYCILCLAENSVGPLATRPDDIIKLYSGKTVEVNNTDAEGRLVLGDGVAYAVKHLSPTVIFDMATLTGAQGIATGLRHAGIFCNNDDLEKQVIASGKASGNLVHPLLYCPEFHRKEFTSAVADMKNLMSVRTNAGSSCAGQFIGSHMLGFQEKGLWCHIDMAYPVHEGERATGWGVSLMYDLCHKL